MIEPCACIKETAEFDMIVVASTVILVDMIILGQTWFNIFYSETDGYKCYAGVVRVG